MGSGTTAAAAIKLGRQFIGFETNPDYYEKSLERLKIKEPKYNTSEDMGQGQLLFEKASRYKKRKQKTSRIHQKNSV